MLQFQLLGDFNIFDSEEPIPGLTQALTADENEVGPELELETSQVSGSMPETEEEQLAVLKAGCSWPPTGTLRRSRQD